MKTKEENVFCSWMYISLLIESILYYLTSFKDVECFILKYNFDFFVVGLSNITGLIIYFFKNKEKIWTT